MRTGALVVLALLGSGAARAAESPTPLKAGQGAEAASGYCNVCHTSDYIIMNSVFLSPAAWKAEVAKMRTVFGAPIDESTAADIAAYLAANYAVKP
jgi:mono/diheme cytochrome c family protein